ncbi:MAG: hypothetical protein GVX96_01710 [Bacteroidetes bacterium]|nr:hypothetical protein [Bacteroidota bacterium]
MKTLIIVVSFLLACIGNLPILFSNSPVDNLYQHMKIETSATLTSDETDLIYGMIGLFESFEDAEFNVDSFSLDTSISYQDLLIFLDENHVNTSLVDSLGLSIESAASNLSNSISDGRFAGLILIATDMYFEGVSSIPDYMSSNSYSDSDIEYLGNHLLSFEMPSGDSSPICNNLFLESVSVILSKYASFNGKRGVSRPNGFAIGSGLGIYVAALNQCNCLCTKYGKVPDGCKSCI